MAVTWSETYRVGNPILDRQHRNLFDWINKLEDLIEGRPGATPANEIIDFLRTYVRTHFCYEEMCMHRLGCPVAGKNRDAHDRFAEVFHAFELRAGRGLTAQLLRQFHATLEGWLVIHIRRIDVEIRRCVAAGN